MSVRTCGTEPWHAFVSSTGLSIQIALLIAHKGWPVRPRGGGAGRRALQAFCHYSRMCGTGGMPAGQHAEEQEVVCHR